MATRMNYNKTYYQEHREAEKARSLEYYHANKEKVDREKQKAYMREYLKTYKRRKLSPEEKAERNRKRRERYANDPEFREKERRQARTYNAKHPMKKRNGRLKAEFGITLQDYDQLLKQQGGRCAICGKDHNQVNHPRPRKFFYVDHDHKTGKVRGLLCHSCNMGLGYFKDNPELLQQAINYLSNG